MGSQKGVSSLLELPDELIVHIFSGYHTVRSGQPQSQAFRNKEIERERQRNNCTKKRTLYALCLTDRRLRKICTPMLYSSFHGSTTLHGIKPLRTFFNTITDNKELAGYVQYIENRLSDYLGNDLLHDTEAHDAEDMVPEYFSKLASVIRLCPNIQQMCVVSIESNDISLWDHLVSVEPFRGLTKLHTLAFQTNTKEEYAFSWKGPAFSRICTALSIIPSLHRMSVSGAVSLRDLNVPIRGTFENLHCVEIEESMVDLRDIDGLLNACNRLKTFKCHWAFLTLRLPHGYIDLLPSIVKHKDTLETLWLVPQLVDFSSMDPPKIHFSNLCHLTRLREAKLCNFFVPDRYTFHSPVLFAEPRLAFLVPPSLEHLTIKYSCYWAHASTYTFHILSILWELVDDCTQRLPHLRELIIQSEEEYLNRSDSAPPIVVDGIKALAGRLQEMGVHFSLVAELDVLA